MQEHQINNNLILPIKRPHSIDSPTQDSPFPYSQTLSENYFESFQDLLGNSKVIWSLPPADPNSVSPIQAHSSSVFSTSDLENWQISVSLNKEITKVSLNLLDFKNPSKIVQVSGKIKIWTFYHKKFVKNFNSNFAKTLSLENSSFDWETFIMINIKKTHQIVLEIELNTLSTPEMSKLATGYIGISDDGLSGLINCVLQSVYHLNSVKTAILHSSSSENFKFDSLRSILNDIQQSDSAVNPLSFIESLELSEDNLNSTIKDQNYSYIIKKLISLIVSQKTIKNLFTGLLEKKSCPRDFEFLNTINEEFTEVVLDIENCVNIYESIKVFLGVNGLSDLQKPPESEEKRSLKFVSLPDILVFVLNSNGEHNLSFEYYPEIDMKSFTREGSSCKYFLFSQIIETTDQSSKRFINLTSTMQGLFRFNNEYVTKLNNFSLCYYWRGLTETYKMTGLGLTKKLIKNPAKVLIYLKADRRVEILESHLSALNTQPKPVKNTENIAEVSLVGLEMIIGWKGPGILSPQSSPAFLLSSMKSLMAKSSKGQDLRIELSKHISGDFRLWTFTPGIKNWEFKELKLNDSVVNERAIFVEVILQTPVFLLLNDWQFLHTFDEKKGILDYKTIDENLEILTPSSAKAIVFYKWYDWNQGQPVLIVFKMVTLTQTSNMSQIRKDLFESWKNETGGLEKMTLHLEKCKIIESKNKENIMHVYSYRPNENYELTLSKRGSFGVRHVIIDNGDCFIGEKAPDMLPDNYMDAKKYISTFFN